MKRRTAIKNGGRTRHEESVAPDSAVGASGIGPLPGALESERVAAGSSVIVSLPDESPPHAPALPFFVVAVGASAGGLEALADLFRHVSPESGLAFVVIVHLSPDGKSMMAELLSRHTKLSVVSIEDLTSPIPNCIHVMLPNRVVTLEGGVFRSVDGDQDRRAMPVNVFLGSLAEAQGDQAVAIILSGTGTDGTHGARLIKESGGLVMVQEPGSAKFDGMPRSAIDGGSVDFVATPRHLAERLEAYVSEAVERLAGEKGDPAGERRAFDEIVRLLCQQSKIDFSMYKPATILRRIQRRAGLLGERSLDSYARLLLDKPPELEHLARELLIGVTQFFRDPAAWVYLEEAIIAQLLASVGERGTLRLWVAGCATGEEAYTLAMLLEEQIRELPRPVSYRLFATDVRRDSLRFARAGIYPASACLGIPEHLCERYFETRGAELVVKRALRDAVTFAPHDLLSDPPFTQLDLVTCRNLLIYLDGDAQRQVLSRFRTSLKEGGFLFLGASESIGESNPQFRAFNARANVFVARGSVSPTSSMLPSLRELAADASANASIRPRISRSTEALYEAAVERYVPPGVAVDSNFELLQVFGRVSDFMSVPSGRVTISLLKMVPQSLAAILSSAGRRALSRGEEVLIPDVRVPAADGEQMLSVRVLPIEDLPGIDLGLLIFFESPRVVPLSASPLHTSELDALVRARLRELEDELLVSRENLSSAVQDLEASNEELQAANEELVVSNEELQSTNEELSSVNEELYTVNSEYQDKIGELSGINVDLENLLRVVDAGVLFLDEQLTIRRFNEGATRLFPLRQEDLGRPLQEIAVQAEYSSLVEDAERVLASGERKRRTVLGHDGAWWSIGLRAARDQSGSPAGGIIIALQEVSELERVTSEFSRLTRAHSIVETVSNIGHAVLDLTNEVVQYSEGARRLLGLGDTSPPLEDVLGLFAVDATVAPEHVLVKLRVGKGLPFTAVRQVSVAGAPPVRLRLSVEGNVDPASGAGLVFVVFQQHRAPS